MGRRGQRRVLDEFSFSAQAEQYRALFAELTEPAAAAPIDSKV
jgi:hypothetical protein